MSFLIIYVTHPSKPEAVRITTELLNNKLIACANYIPIESVFWWEGFLTKSEEVVTLYKTRVENWEVVKSAIESSHKNEVPCIIKLATVEANEKYEKWIQDVTSSDFSPKARNIDNFDSLFQK
jgi:periplasmic divalent cation tolerance protein